MLVTGAVLSSAIYVDLIDRIQSLDLLWDELVHLLRYSKSAFFNGGHQLIFFCTAQNHRPTQSSRIARVEVASISRYLVRLDIHNSPPIFFHRVSGVFLSSANSYNAKPKLHSTSLPSTYWVNVCRNMRQGWNKTINWKLDFYNLSSRMK